MTDLTLSIIAATLQIVSVYLSYQYTVHRTDGGKNLKTFFSPRFNWICLALCGAAFILSVFVFAHGFLFGEDAFMRAFMNAEVFIWLVVLGYVDFKEKIIPNHLIWLGLLFWFAVALIEIFIGGTPWKSVAVFSLLGGVVCGGVLLIIALIVKTALGMGDVKMFFVLGLLYGVSDTYSILLFSIVIMAIVSIALLAVKKATTKTKIPMAPFVAAGFLISILAGM